MKTGSYNGASNVVLDSKLEGFERGFVTSLAGKNSNFFCQKWPKNKPLQKQSEIFD